MLFYAVALHGAAKRFSALTKFSAADFGYRLARLAGGRVVNDAEVRAAFGEKRRQTLKNQKRGGARVRLFSRRCE